MCSFALKVLLVPLSRTYASDLATNVISVSEGARKYHGATQSFLDEVVDKVAKDSANVLRRRTRERPLRHTGVDQALLGKGGSPSTDPSQEREEKRRGQGAAAKHRGPGGPILSVPSEFLATLKNSEAAEALRSPQEALRKMGQRGADAWAVFLKDQDRWVIQMGKARERLLTDQDIRKSFEALGKKGEAGTDTVASFLKDQDPSIRLDARQILSKMGKAGADTAAALLKNQDPSVKLDAINVLGNMGADGGAYMAEVAALLKDPYPSVKRAALEALGRMGQASDALSAEVSALVEKQLGVTLAQKKLQRNDLEGGTGLRLGKPNQPGQGGIQSLRDSLAGKLVANESQLASLKDKNHQISIITTAALPWMTGTAVNPLLRAAHLARTDRRVVLLVPWLAEGDQKRVFPPGVTFDRPARQEAYMRKWLRRRVGFRSNFDIRFYPGRYAVDKGSVVPVGEITRYVPDEEADVAILEEPEHLNWYHHGPRWTDKFKYVVGIVHTNYLDYTAREDNAYVKVPILKFINQWVCRAYCHKVVKLSDAVQTLPKEVTCFVHGVSPKFLEVGRQKAEQLVKMEVTDKNNPFPKGAYFLGKVLWGKGYTELFQLVYEYTQKRGTCPELNIYGSGPDLAVVKAKAQESGIDCKFHGACDHLDASIRDYKVFINPSRSDVVATTTAEALAMGKFVVVEDLPCNEFFSTFDNCLTYRNADEFAACLDKALTSEPRPLSAMDRSRLKWDTATQRFLDIAEPKDTDVEKGFDKLRGSAAYYSHYFCSGFEPLRQIMGAGHMTRDCPEKVTDVRAYDEEKDSAYGLGGVDQSKRPDIKLGTGTTKFKV